MKHSNRNSISAWIRYVVLLILKGYKKFLSPFLPSACRFEPTCSVYMYQAIQKMGIMKGLYWGIRRILRCHPFCEGGFDPVP
jgi:putative membrane protein insertion efficiency factor